MNWSMCEDNVSRRMMTPNRRAAETAHRHRTKMTRDMYYIDALEIGGLFNSIVRFLQLQNSYSIFLLNPHTPIVNTKNKGFPAVYGYRRGWSESELQFMYQNPIL